MQRHGDMFTKAEGGAAGKYRVKALRKADP